MADAVAASGVVHLRYSPAKEIADAFSGNPKVCRKCKQTKTDCWDNFRAHRTPKHGVHVKRVCRTCEISDRMEYERKNRDAQNAKRRDHPKARARYRARNLKREYGITQAQYDILAEAQNYKCAICGDETSPGRWKEYGAKLCVDHCHSTGRIRGLLCATCNRGLGHFRDNIIRLMGAITYLERHHE